MARSLCQVSSSGFPSAELMSRIGQEPPVETKSDEVHDTRTLYEVRVLRHAGVTVPNRLETESSRDGQDGRCVH